MWGAPCPQRRRRWSPISDVSSLRVPIADHPDFQLPPGAAQRIWRYMDFTKFVSMLDSGGLFFAQAATLEDPFEGSFTVTDVETRPELPRSPVPR